MGETKVAQRGCDPGMLGVKNANNERSSKKIITDYDNFQLFLEPVTVPTHCRKNFADQMIRGRAISSNL